MASTKGSYEGNLMSSIYTIEHFLLTTVTDNYVQDWQNLFQIRRSFAAALVLYLYLGLREMPRTAIMIQRMVKRLRSTLRAAQMMGRIDSIGLNILFWMTTLGACASSDVKIKMFFQVRSEESSIRLGLGDEESRLRMLTGILWRENIEEHQHCSRVLVSR